jgi:hypothetical protein
VNEIIRDYIVKDCRDRLVAAEAGKQVDPPLTVMDQVVADLADAAIVMEGTLAKAAR